MCVGIRNRGHRALSVFVCVLHLLLPVREGEFASVVLTVASTVLSSRFSRVTMPTTSLK
jgi:hypothetical protein